VPLTRVIIICDAPLVRAGLRVFLEAADIRVIAEMGLEEERSLPLARRGHHVVLLGCQGGQEEVALSRLRRIKEAHPEVSVVVITPSRSPRVLSRALSLGCSGYLLITVGRRELVRAIRSIVGGECVLEPAELRETLRKLPRQPRHGAPPLVEPLSVPERDVLRLITGGQTNREIAGHLGYSVGTVKDYVQRIIEKLGVSDRTQAAVLAVRRGLVE
jgi:DNA-binding NarL/FixJ family response regulator